MWTFKRKRKPKPVPRTLNVRLTPEQTLEVAKMLDGIYRLPDDVNREQRVLMWIYINKLGRPDWPFKSKINTESSTHYIIEYTEYIE